MKNTFYLFRPNTYDFLSFFSPYALAKTSSTRWNGISGRRQPLLGSGLKAKTFNVSHLRMVFAVGFL